MRHWPAARATASMMMPATRKRTASRVSGGQSCTAILAAANAELHSRQNTAMGPQVARTETGAGPLHAAGSPALAVHVFIDAFPFRVQMAGPSGLPGHSARRPIH